MKRLVLTGLVLFWAASAPAAVRYVNKAATGANNGTSWANAFTTIQPAINAAVAGDEIWVAAGDYNELRPDGEGALILKANVALYGGFAGWEWLRDQRNWETRLTIINGAVSRAGNPAYSVVRVTVSNATLDGFFIQGGNANAGSGAASTQRGGGVFVEAQSFTMRNCTVRNNNATVAGGGMTIRNCFNADGRLVTVQYCTFHNNTTSTANTIDIGLGGGLNLQETDARIYGCTFHTNTARYGGGIYAVKTYPGVGNNITHRPPLIFNCVFYGNIAREVGGGIHNHNATTNIRNCTFYNNTSQTSGFEQTTNNGGAIALTNSDCLPRCPSGDTATHGRPEVRNCAVVYNTGASQIVRLFGSDYLILDNNHVVAALGSEFQGAGSNNFRPAAGGPLIDSSNANSETLNRDRDGTTRPLIGVTGGAGGAKDRGAYEYDQLAPSLTCQNRTYNLSASNGLRIWAADLIASTSDAGGVKWREMDGGYFIVDCSKVGNTVVAVRVRDFRGNQSTCNATITVVDDVNPVITTCSPNQSANANASCQAAVPNFTAGVVATDNCTPAGSLVVTQSPVAGTLLGPGTHTITITVRDASNNAATCNATFTVNDVTPPVISACAPNQVVSANASCQAAVPDFRGGVVATDNCGTGALTVTQSPAVGTLVGLGTHTITLTVRDAANNTATCATTTLTVNDTTPPTITTCAPNQVVSANASCQAAVPDFTGGVVASDNCTPAGNLVITQSPAVGALVGTGSHTITLTVRDAANNTATCNATLTVNDTTPPTITTCAPNQVVSANASCQAAVPDFRGGVVASDNCTPAGNLVITQSPAVGALVGTGTHTITLTVRDAANNTATCNATLTVNDMTPPVINSCPSDQILNLNANCQVAIPNLAALVTAVDNCTAPGDLVVTQNPASGALVSVDTLVTMTVTDEAGNVVQCTAWVRVQDATPPVITLDGNNPETVQCGSTYTDAGATAADNCDTGLVPVAVSTVDVSTTGTYTVTYTVSDAAGNAATPAVRTVNVVDTTPPVISDCPADQTLDLDGSCEVTVPDLTGLVIATDNCSDAAALAITQNPPAGTPVSVDTLVTLTVTDEEGNATDCSATIFVQDVTPPSIVVCPPPVLLVPDASCQVIVPDFTIGVVATDNCTAPGSLTITQDPAAGEIVTGSTTVTITVTDAWNNAVTCQTDVFVVDTTNPVAACQNITVNLSAPTIDGQALDGGSTDNCGITTWLIDGMLEKTFVCADIPSVNVILTVLDAAGNFDSCVATVTVVDDVDPVMVCQDITVNLSAPLIGPADIDGGSADACGITSLLIDGGTERTFTCADVGDVPVELQATDAAGNTATCTALVTVVDNIAPVAIARNVTRNLSAGGQVTAADVNNGSSDNCGPVTLSLQDGPVDVSCANLGSRVVTLVVEDAGGNIATDTAVVTIQDNVPPVAVCQDITVNLSSPLIGGSDLDGGSSDTCGITVWLVDGQPSKSFICADLGENTIELRVEDAAGNFDTCTATVTVVDDIAPVAACQDITVNLSSPTITGDDLDGGSTDNCDIAARFVDGANTRTFTCADLGVNTVELRVEDAAGNFDTCTATVTVVDDTAPVAVCQDVVAYLSAGGQVTAADVDGGSSDDCSPVTLSLEDGPLDVACVNVGAHTVTLLVEDAAGNVSRCTATVTIVDDVPPAAVCQDATVQLDAAGIGVLTVPDLDGGSSDNCAIASMTLDRDVFTCIDTLAPVTVMLIVRDEAGNQSTCTASVTVIDPLDTCALVVTQLGEISVTKMATRKHTFGVAVSGGIGVINMQWQFAPASGPDAGVFFDLVDSDSYYGTLTTALTIDPLDLIHTGEYRCEVSDQSGSVVNSGIFTLLVTPQVPVTGVAGLALLALFAAAGGAAAIRRRR